MLRAEVLSQSWVWLNLTQSITKSLHLMSTIKLNAVSKAICLEIVSPNGVCISPVLPPFYELVF